MPAPAWELGIEAGLRVWGRGNGTETHTSLSISILARAVVMEGGSAKALGATSAPRFAISAPIRNLKRRLPRFRHAVAA